jgi:hypothetical protein
MSTTTTSLPTIAALTTTVGSVVLARVKIILLTTTALSIK